MRRLGAGTGFAALAALAALTVLALALAACGAPADPSTTPPTTAPTEAISPATEPPATEPPATEPVSPDATTPAESLDVPTPAGAVIEDPSLLSVLPSDVGGVVVAHEAQAFTDAAGDKAFATNVRSAAFAVAVDGENLASAVVAKLNPGTYSDAFFRDWRDSYNEGACGQAGGLVGNAESQLGEQTVYIGSCAGGLRTYHAWVESRGVIVSAFSLGDRKLGELLMAGLRP